MKQLVVKSRTIGSLGFLDRAGRQSPLIDALTASPKSYSCMLLLFPFRREVYDRIINDTLQPNKEKLMNAQRELYKHVYQVVGSLILAIINVENVRKIRAATDYVEERFGIYEKAAQQNKRDNAFEEAVQKARQLRTDVDALIDQLADAPHRLDLCERIVSACKRYGKIYDALRDLGFVEWRKLFENKPRFSICQDGTPIESVDSILNFLGGNDMPFPVEQPRLNVRLAGIQIKLTPNAREHTAFFNAFLPTYKFPDLHPIGLLVKTEEKTYFADLFLQVELQLRTRYECEEIRAANGAKVFFPKIGTAEVAAPDTPPLP